MATLLASTRLARLKVKTPCIGVCSTGIGDAVCRGCKRFAHEVIDWNAYSEAEKRIVDCRLAEFLSLCMKNRFEVIDPGLLRWQLETQQIQLIYAMCGCPDKNEWVGVENLRFYKDLLPSKNYTRVLKEFL